MSYPFTPVTSLGGGKRTLAAATDVAPLGEPTPYVPVEVRRQIVRRAYLALW
jgi:hypothetical protein